MNWGLNKKVVGLNRLNTKIYKELNLFLVMESELYRLLKEYGLDENEIRIYVYLVGNKELTAYKIAKETRIHRSTTYDILDRLIAKGFVSKIEKEIKQVYLANEASKILASVKEKESLLLSIMPRLQQLEEKQETKVKFIENPHSQSEFDVKILDLLKQGKITFFYMIGNGPANRPGQMLLLERLIKEAKKLKLHKKIDYKGIWDSQLKQDPYIRLFNSLGPNKFLKNIPTKVTIIIFDEHLAFLYTTDTAGLIEIKNNLICEEMKAYFSYLWDKAK